MKHKNAPKGVVPFSGPTLVRYKDATRFLWGDRKSGEVADVIYGRNEVIGTLIYKLKPGGFFRSSELLEVLFRPRSILLRSEGRGRGAGSRNR